MSLSDKIFFLHIPKTAGSSFNAILQSKYPADVRFHVTAGSMTTARRYYEITSEILSTLDQRILNKVQLIHGHVPFADQPSLSAFSYITFLREPVKRVISDYLFSRSTPALPLYHILQGMSLKDYVGQNRDLHLDNLQTRMLSGVMNGPLEESHLAAAEFNLHNRFKFYGLTESFDYSLVKLNKALGWNLSTYAVKNVTKSEPANFTSADMDAVHDQNKFDLLLYNRAAEKFKKDVEAQRDFFDQEVKKIVRTETSKSKGGNIIVRKFRKLLK